MARNNADGLGTPPPCGFCQDKPVGNAATWVDGKPRPPAPCPRCGKQAPAETTKESAQ